MIDNDLHEGDVVWVYDAVRPMNLLLGLVVRKADRLGEDPAPRVIQHGELYIDVSTAPRIQGVPE